MSKADGSTILVKRRLAPAFRHASSQLRVPNRSHARPARPVLDFILQWRIKDSRDYYGDAVCVI